MKCDRCGNEATVHEVTIKGGKKIERHLCEACAGQHGLAVAGGGAHSDPGKLVAQAIVLKASGATEAQQRAAASSCPGCGLTFAQFRHAGLLGCPECYRAFETTLSPLLERAHEGGTHHVGKTPRRASPAGAAAAGGPAGGRGGFATTGRASSGGAEAAAGAPGTPSASPAPSGSDAGERLRRVTALRRELDRAVGAEQYERAAQLRDQLRAMGEIDGPSGGSAGGGAGGAGEPEVGGEGGRG